MTRSERCAQVWQVLVSAAHNRQILTCKVLAAQIGMGPGTLSQPLDTVLVYCALKHLPPLTVLVVHSKTGRPAVGSGVEDVPEGKREAVFNHRWFERRVPSAEQLEAPFATLPSS